jgi:uncharacterized phage-associated protein
MSQTFSYSPSVIANYFITGYGDGENLTPMKVIKIVYISYGWFLALTNGKRLVNEKPQAWNLGPVFPSLYHSLKKYGSLHITEPIPLTYGESPEKITDKTIKKFLDIIWRAYGKYDAITLSSITHTEDTPWSEVFPSGFNVTIPDSLIQKHYQLKLDTNKKELVFE